DELDDLLWVPDDEREPDDGARATAEHVGRRCDGVQQAARVFGVRLDPPCLPFLLGGAAGESPAGVAEDRGVAGERIPDAVEEAGVTVASRDQQECGP